MLAIAPLPLDDPYGTFDYANAEGAGTWWGTAAESRGLLGKTVTREAFANLYEGLAEDGRYRLGHKHSFPAWWVIFTPPKSVHALPLLVPQTAVDIEAADKVALSAGLGVLEERCAWTRRGAQGKRLEKGRGLFFAMFPHYLTRARQFGPHWQGVMFNKVERADGSYGAVPGIRSTRAARNKNAKHGSAHRSPLYAAKMEAGERYRSVLRAELEARGIRTRDRENFGFELEGVSERLIQHFSRRRQEVLEKADELRAELKRDGKRVPHEAKLLQWAARSSRDAKPANINLAQLSEQWREEAKHTLELERAQRQQEREL